MSVSSIANRLVRRRLKNPTYLNSPMARAINPRASSRDNHTSAIEGNPRTEFPAHELEELAADISERGILQPIVVDRVDPSDRYLIRFGAKRFRAARLARLKEVPVTVSWRPRDAYDQVAENLKRHALSPLDMARFIRGRIDAGESNAAIAKRLAIDQTTVAHHLSLLSLPPVLEDALTSGRCTSPTERATQRSSRGGRSETSELSSGCGRALPPATKSPSHLYAPLSSDTRASRTRSTPRTFKSNAIAEHVSGSGEDCCQ
jgi:ParB/RepB/Spo0J family partition protein